MIFALRFSRGSNAVMVEPVNAPGSTYAGTPREWCTWCRRCGATAHHGDHKAAKTADKRHRCEGGTR